MTADLTTSAGRALNDSRRDQLITALGGTPALKWQVIRQHKTDGEVVDTVACEHRTEWAAEWCARRQTRRDATRDGAYFDARRTDS